MFLTLAPRPRILIIRRDNIGDLVCSTPAIATLRKHYPGALIAALVNTYNAQVLRGNPNLDQIFIYEKLKLASSIARRLKAIAKRVKLIAQIRRWNPDVIVLAKPSYDRHGLNLARQIGAKNIIGCVPDDLAKTKALPDTRLKTPEVNGIHEVEAVNHILKPLGIDIAPGPLKVFPVAGVVASIQSRLPNAAKRIALHISAREAERRWGDDNFIALAKAILSLQADTQLLLFWSPGQADDPYHPGDDEAAARLIQAIGRDRIIPIPTQNLTELIAALSLCDLFIGADGGALHLAAGLSKPCVALFENLPSKLNHWYPWQVPCRLVHGERTEVAHIPLEAVTSALESLQAEISRQV